MIQLSVLLVRFLMMVVNTEKNCVEIDQRLIPVRVRYENKLLWFVSSMGSVTSYDDIEKAGGKFFKKFSKTS